MELQGISTFASQLVCFNPYVSTLLLNPTYATRCIAAADRAYLKPLGAGAGVGLHAVFAGWLRFLRHLVRAQEALAVFDEPSVGPPTGSRLHTELQCFRKI